MSGGTRWSGGRGECLKRRHLLRWIGTRGSPGDLLTGHAPETAASSPPMTTPLTCAMPSGETTDTAICGIGVLKLSAPITVAAVMPSCESFLHLEVWRPCCPGQRSVHGYSLLP